MQNPSGTQTLTKVSGTYSYTDAGGEQTIYEFTDSSDKIIDSIHLDTSNCVTGGTVKTYFKVDGTNYHNADAGETVSMSQELLTIKGPIAIDDDFKITYTEDSDEGADVDIYYAIYYRTY